MRSILIVALVSLCLPGCGLFPLPPNPKLEVTDAIRAACPTQDGTPLEDDLLRDALLWVDAVRADGASKAEVLDLEIRACQSGCPDGNTTCEGYCAQCMTAIVSQVYDD